MPDSQLRTKSMVSARGARSGPQDKNPRTPVAYSETARAAASALSAAEGPELYRADPQARIDLVRHGIPASMVAGLASRMGISKERLLASLGLSRATISRKEKESGLLSRDESERVLGVEMLVGLVQTMVEQSGDPTGFDAARWLALWLVEPVPALGGNTPASYMDTFEGQKLVTQLLLMSQSGAYA